MLDEQLNAQVELHLSMLFYLCVVVYNEEGVVQFLLKSWIKKIERLTPEFIDKYINTGEISVLK